MLDKLPIDIIRKIIGYLRPATLSELYEYFMFNNKRVSRAVRPLYSKWIITNHTYLCHERFTEGEMVEQPEYSFDLNYEVRKLLDEKYGYVASCKIIFGVKVDIPLGWIDRYLFSPGDFLSRFPNLVRLEYTLLHEDHYMMLRRLNYLGAKGVKQVILNIEYPTDFATMDTPDLQTLYFCPGTKSVVIRQALYEKYYLPYSVEKLFISVSDQPLYCEKLPKGYAKIDGGREISLSFTGLTNEEKRALIGKIKKPPHLKIEFECDAKLFWASRCRAINIAKYSKNGFGGEKCYCVWADRWMKADHHDPDNWVIAKYGDPYAKRR